MTQKANLSSYKTVQKGCHHSSTTLHRQGVWKAPTQEPGVGWMLRDDPDPLWPVDDSEQVLSEPVSLRPQSHLC